MPLSRSRAVLKPTLPALPIQAPIPRFLRFTIKVLTLASSPLNRMRTDVHQEDTTGKCGMISGWIMAHKWIRIDEKLYIYSRDMHLPLQLIAFDYSLIRKKKLDKQAIEYRN